MKKNGLIVDTDGNQRWYLNDKRHRTDGPAVVYADGTQHWYLDGKRHRIDGPAIVSVDGDQEWYLDDKFLGDNSVGFWALWDLLTDEQRNNLTLHMYLPGIRPEDIK